MKETSKEQAPAGHAESLLVDNVCQKATSHPEKPEISSTQEAANTEPPYTILAQREKIFTIILASFAAFISPVSSSIYFPALNPLAKDLNVTPSAINISITVYIVIQGLAPTFIGSISDKNGRRPAFLICFVLYVAANIGLALQNSYAALLILRCLQAAGSSGTVALGNAVVADIVTRAERGKYIGYSSMGVTLGPALGPIIGGLLSHYLGWRSIFWFLTIFAGVMTVLIILVLPETSRSVVGNGSVPPQKWNLSVLDLYRKRQRRKLGIAAEVQTIAKRKRRPSPLEAVKIAFQKETGMILFSGALLYAGFFAVLAGLPSQLQEKYHFNTLQIGLCYLPYGLGSLTSRWTVGTLLDWNYRRHARRLGIEIVKNRQQKLSDFPIEVVRLQITLPLVFFACLSMIAYGWVMNFKTNLAGPVITLFLTGHTATGAFSSLNTLIIDINVESPATAAAANNLVRCPFGAGAVAAAVPLINRIGMGWACTFVAGIWVATTPMIWMVFRYGFRWRQEKSMRDEERTRQENVETGTEIVVGEEVEQEKEDTK